MEVEAWQGIQLSEGEYRLCRSTAMTGNRNGRYGKAGTEPRIARRVQNPFAMEQEGTELQTMRNVTVDFMQHKVFDTHLRMELVAGPVHDGS